MAIVKEKLEGNLILTYSDAGFYIHGGNPECNYVDAIDPAELNVEYTETDIPIEHDPEDTDAEYIQAAKIMLGEEDI